MQVFLSYAFRPFFLFNAVFAMSAMLLWAFVLQGNAPAFLPAETVLWHAHEMISGFAGAAMAGFVLTAVATWTGRAPVGGLWLGLLVLSWLIGRTAMLFGGVLSPATVMTLDMLFPVLFALLVAREIIGAGNRRNYPIIFICLLFAFLNFLYHMSRTGMVSQIIEGDRIALLLLVHLVLLLITVIAGRIIPNFTANWLRARGRTPPPDSVWFIERATITFTIFAGLVSILWPFSTLAAVLTGCAALAHFFRLLRWRGLATISEPLLFVLHVAYLWLPVGYGLMALSITTGVVQPSAALHALTAGAISLMVLAVTSRVALAHTGRALHAGRLTVAAYVLLLTAGLVRVFSPIGSLYLSFLNLSIALWVTAFGMFCVVYAPILLRPPADQ